MNADNSDESHEAKNRLTAMQFRVTQQCGTEPPFHNEFWNNKRPGIYVDVVSGEPLFSSLDKFDSGTGWPSFTKPLKETGIVNVADDSHGMSRVEVRSKKANSHLGHVFDDGPKPTGQRYCINSASLRFIPAEDLEKEGYGEYNPHPARPLLAVVFFAFCAKQPNNTVLLLIDIYNFTMNSSP